jgi:hypothetical protein
MTAVYFTVWLLCRLAAPLFAVKAWAERYSDPSTHSAWVINNWHKFKANPIERFR